MHRERARVKISLLMIVNKNAALLVFTQSINLHSSENVSAWSAFINPKENEGQSIVWLLRLKSKVQVHSLLDL